LTGLWLVFALMTAAAIFAVVWPLSRRTPARDGSDLAVYRDQLAEIARDRAAGLIGETEAEAAQIEVSRRLLAAAQVDHAHVAPSSSVWRRRATTLAALIILPTGATAIYLALESRDLPGEPLAGRVAQAHHDKSIAAMLTQVEAHLERNPNDVRGWQVIAPVYLRLGRADQAVTAQGKLFQLQGENADRDADLGEALTAAANGVVTGEAKAAFEKAVNLDPEQLKAQFFLGVAAQQDGDKQKDAEIWNALLAKEPPGAAWADTVREALARAAPAANANAQPGPNASDVAAASQMSEAQRNDMIHGMVARLADRLKAGGSDLESWQKLLRAYVVLGDRAQAHAAAVEAKKALASDPGKLHDIEDVFKTLGLES
jgi:cytochrome c-type biogenesis protein CcmH